MGAVGQYDSDGSKKQEVPKTLEYVERPFKPYTKCCEYDFFRICLLAGPEHHYCADSMYEGCDSDSDSRCPAHHHRACRFGPKSTEEPKQAPNKGSPSNSTMAIDEARKAELLDTSIISSPACVVKRIISLQELRHDVFPVPSLLADIGVSRAVCLFFLLFGI